MGYIEKSDRGHSRVGRYYSGEDPNKRFSRFFGVGDKPSRGRKAASSAEKSWYEELGASISDVAEDTVDAIKKTYKDLTR